MPPKSDERPLPSTTDDQTISGRISNNHNSHSLARSKTMNSKMANNDNMLLSPHTPDTASLSIANSQKQHQPPFFQLPREIRDQILYNFYGDKCIFTWKPIPAEYFPITHIRSGERIRFACDGTSEVSTASRFATPLYLTPTKALLRNLRVSRRFHHEALEMLFSTSGFYFSGISPFEHVLDHLPMRYQKLVREVGLDIDAEEVEGWRWSLRDRVARHLPGLRTLRISVDVPMDGWEWRDSVNLCIRESTSFADLEEAEIILRRGNVEGRKLLSREEVVDLFARLAEALK